MAMIVEFLYRFFTFDLAWLLGFIFNPANLLWLFLFGAAAYFFYVRGTSKNLFWATVFVTFWIWVSNDFSVAVGWQLFNRDLLAMLLLSSMVTLAFFANDSWGKTRLPLINTLRFIIVLAFFNMIL